MAFVLEDEPGTVASNETTKPGRFVLEPEPDPEPFRQHVAAQPRPSYGGPGPVAAVPPASMTTPRPAPPVVSPVAPKPELPLVLQAPAGIIPPSEMRPKTPEEVIAFQAGGMPKPLSPEAAELANAREAMPEPSVTKPPVPLFNQPLAAAKIGLKNSISGMLGTALAGGGQKTAEEQRYDPGLLDKGIEAIFNLAADPLTIAAFAVGSVPGAVAAKQLAVGFAKKFGPQAALRLVQSAQAIGGGATSFGTFDAVTTTLRQIISTQRGEPTGQGDQGQPTFGVQPKEILKATGRGMVLGGAMGAGGALAAGGGTLLRKAVEVGVLASVPPLQQGRTPTAEDWIDAGVLVGSLTIAGRLSGLAKRAIAKPAAERTPVEIQVVRNLSPEIKQIIAQEAALKTSQEIASQRAAAIETRPKQEEAVEPQVEAVPVAAEAGLKRRGVEPVTPKDTLALAAERGKQPVPAEAAPPAPAGPLRTAREIATGEEPAATEAPAEAQQRMVAAAKAPNLAPYLRVPSTFKEFVEAHGRRWPLMANEPGYLDLRGQWDELRRPLYEVQGPRLGQWEIVNRISNEVEGQAPNRAMAQLKANQLDAARMAPLPAGEFKALPPYRTEPPAPEGATPAPEPPLPTGQEAKAVPERPAEPPVPAPEPEKAPAMPPEAMNEALGRMYQELKDAEAGRRIPVYNRARTQIEEWIAQPSTYPDWMPKDMRTRRGADQLMAAIDNVLEGKPEGQLEKIVREIAPTLERRYGMEAPETKTPEPEPPEPPKAPEAERNLSEFQWGIRDYMSGIAPGAGPDPAILRDPFFERWGGEERIVNDVFGGDREALQAELNRAATDVAEGRVQEPRPKYGLARRQLGTERYVGTKLATTRPIWGDEHPLLVEPEKVPDGVVVYQTINGQEVAWTKNGKRWSGIVNGKRRNLLGTDVWNLPEGEDRKGDWTWRLPDDPENLRHSQSAPPQYRESRAGVIDVGTQDYRVERTPEGEQALIPGAEKRAIPTTPLKAEAPQKPVETTPLFRGEPEAEQPRLPGVEEARPPAPAPVGKEPKPEYAFRDDANETQRANAEATEKRLTEPITVTSPESVPSERRLKEGAGVRVLGAKVGGEIARRGRVTFAGQRIETAEDLALIGQVASDPQVESFRVIPVKDGIALPDSVISARLPGTSPVFLDFTPEQAERITAAKEWFANDPIGWRRQLPRPVWETIDRLQRLGADGYWLLHNHPGGTPKPSRADVHVTDLFAKAVPGFKGHVVIDSKAYGVIEVSGRGANPVDKVVPADFAERSTETVRQHPFIGQTLRTYDDLALLGYMASKEAPGGVVVYQGGDGKVSAVEVAPYRFMEGANFRDHLLARMPEYGASSVYVYLPREAGLVVDKLDPLIREGLIRDLKVQGSQTAMEAMTGSEQMAAENAYGRLVSRLSRERQYRVHEPEAPYGAGVTDPAMLRDLDEYGREVRKRKPDYESWAAEMRKELGYRVNPYLQEAWDTMQRGARPEIPTVTAPTGGVPPRRIGTETPLAPGATPPNRDVLADIDAMAKPEKKTPWRERLTKAKERVIETQVNRFEPVRRLSEELKKLEKRGLAQPTGLKPIETMEIAKNRTMGQSQLFAGKLETIIKDSTQAGLDADLNRYLTLTQFAKRIRDLAARPDSEVTPDGRTKDGGYVNPRQFDQAKVDAGIEALKQQVGERWPELEAMAKRVWSLNRDLLTRARDVGLVGQETYDAIVGRGEDYVPIQVLDYLDEIGTSAASPRPFDVRYQDVLKRMEGTERDVRNVLASTFDKGLRSIATINRNRAARAVTDLSGTLPGIVDEVPGDTFKVPGDKEVVSAFYDGHRKNFAVSPDIARAMKFLDAEQIGLVGKILAVGKRPLQMGATGANLAFAIPNIIRDTKRLAIYSKYGVESPADLIRLAGDWTKALASVYKQDAAYEKFLSSGAAFSTIQKNLTPEAFVDLAKGQKPLADRLNLLKQSIENVAKINSMLEETTKLAAFQRGLRSGAPIDDVAYEVANYGGSPNFGRAGSWSTHLNLLWMFYNARLQGTAGNIRRVRETPSTAGKAALVRLGVLAGLPILATWAWNQQFDDDLGMEQIPDGERQRYHIFLLPETYRAANGEMRRKYLKLTKEESEQIVGTLLTGALDYIKGQHPQSAATMATDILGAMSPIAFNLRGEPNADHFVKAAASGIVGSANPLLRVPVEVGSNYNAFTQGPLVPKSLEEHVRPTEQVRPTTSPTIAEVAKMMDRVPGMAAVGLTSPIKLQHAITSSTGGLGQSTIDATDFLLAAAAKHLDVPLPVGIATGVPDVMSTYERMGHQVMLSRFMGTGGGQQDRETERRMYEALDHVRRIKGSVKLLQKRGGKEEAAELKESESPLMSARSFLESRAKQLGNIYKQQIETVYFSDRPLEERQQKLVDLAERRHRIMEAFRRREEETGKFTHLRGEPE